MKHSTHDARLIAGATSRARGNTWGWGHAITYSLLTAQRRAGAASDAEQARHRDLVSEISAANQRGALALLRMLAARLPASARACRLAEDAADQARLELRVHLCTHDPIRLACVPRTVVGL